MAKIVLVDTETPDLGKLAAFGGTLVVIDPEALKRIRNGIEARRVPYDMAIALNAIVDNRTRQVSVVQTYFSNVISPDGAPKPARALKALKNLAR